MKVFLLPAFIGLVWAACDSNADVCGPTSPCPSGQVCSNGVCADLIPEPDTVDPPRDQGIDLVADVQTDSLDASDDGFHCKPNGDHEIVRQELFFPVPSTIEYVVDAIAVDLEGNNNNGDTVWDFTSDGADLRVDEMALDPVPAWVAQDFSQADYVSLMNKELDSYGVFKITDDKMSLVGAISGKKDIGRLTYDKPIDLLHFPIKAGDSFTTTTTSTGFWWYSELPPCCAFVSNIETYKVDVIDKGTLKLPKLSFDVALVRASVAIDPYGNPFFKQRYAIFLFIAECYGTVARVLYAGDPGDSLKLPADKVERWRLSNP